MTRERKIGVKIYVFHFGDDNPKRCTALKMARFGVAKVVKRFSEVPYRIPTLDPYTDRVLLPEDREIVLKRGILVADFSWKGRPEPFFNLRKARRLTSRRLPLLLAGNPTAWGRPYKLSSLEAVAAALYILGMREDSREILSLYTWGEKFFELNREPLEAYSRVANKEEILEAEREFFGEVERKEILYGEDQ